MSEEITSKVPSLLFIEEGEYVAEGKYLTINVPLSIYGAGREKTTLVEFGLKINGWKTSGIVEIGDLTIKGVESDGVYACNGMNVIMRGVSVEECGGCGVSASSGGEITCEDLQVIGCGCNGVSASSNGTITLSGEGTSIQRNGTKGDDHYYGLYAQPSFGLNTYSSSSSIRLVHPLTKEQISTNNGGGGNWGDHGTIEEVTREKAASEQAAKEAARPGREVVREAAKLIFQRYQEGGGLQGNKKKLFRQLFTILLIPFLNEHTL